MMLATPSTLKIVARRSRAKQKSSAFIAERFRPIENSCFGPTAGAGGTVVRRFDLIATHPTFLWIDQRQDRVGENF
jgi:hypothetical protein